MAYQQTLPRFNPYIHTTPVEDAIKIGMLKQQQYDENVQKIQSWIDQTAALPVLRQHDRDIIQSKLNGFAAAMSQMGNVDFSQQQVMNSVAGMTSAISRDRDILNGVSSYYNEKKNIEWMDKAREKGELTPQNEDQHTKRFSEYLQSTDTRTWSYKYEPYFDKDKFIIDEFNAVKPDDRKIEEYFQISGDGKIMFNKDGSPVPAVSMVKEYKGFTMEKARAVLAGIMQDPRVQRQLQIDGEYFNKGMDAQTLTSSIKSLKADAQTIYNNDKQQLLAMKAAGKATDADITKLEENWQISSKNYDDLEKSVATNPDYTRGLLYKQTYQHNILDKYRERLSSISYEESPFYKVMWDQYRAAKEDTKWELSFRQKETENKLKMTELGMLPVGTQGFQDPSIDKVSIYENDLARASRAHVNSTDMLLLATVLSDRKGQYQKLIDGGISPEEAASKIVAQAAKESGFGSDVAKYRAQKALISENMINSMTPDELQKKNYLNSLFSTYTKTKKDFTILDATRQKYMSQIPGGLNMDLDIPDLTVRDAYGNPVKVSKQNMIDLGLVLHNSSSPYEWANAPQTRQAAKEAENRLKADGKEYLISAMLAERGGSYLNPVKSAYRKMFPGGDAGNILLGPDVKAFFQAVDNVYSKVGNAGFIQGMAVKSRVINDNYHIKPNLVYDLVTGKGPLDKARFGTLLNFATQYEKAQQNLSPDFNGEEIRKYLNDPEKVKSLYLESRMDPRTGQMMAVVNFGPGLSMTITPEQAQSLGIPMNQIYEDELFTGIRNLIGNNGATSAGDLFNPKTYQQATAAILTKENFPNLRGTNYDVRGNIVESNGLFFPVLYVREGNGAPVVRDFAGKSDLSEAYNGLVNATPQLIQAILNNK